MSRLLEIAIEQEVEKANRAVVDAKNRVDANFSKRGMVRSGSHIIAVITVFDEAAKKLTESVFGRAMAVQAKADVEEASAREAAIAAVTAFIETLRGKVDGVCKMSGASESAYHAAHQRFAEIDADFAREAELYRAGIERGYPLPPLNHNNVTITGNGNTLFAQQGTSHSTQNVQQTNAVLERLSAAIDDLPLTGSARREVEAIVAELKAEAAKAAPEKGRLASLLSNASTALGIVKTAPEVVQAFADVSHTLGIA